ncbi:MULTISPECIES: DUF4190 domain-containing protein [Priestia]|uniref:DUF4190 domain-containing protein n=1 Tax=Priestia megaterium TaxID=1404 RepID=A0AAX6BTB9_PRIMG|nr:MULTISPECIES: DUF4190 domain-containing protein [Priestia]MDN4634584.1 DUF4190 domain-containing protein [Sphingomonas sp. PsM26]HES8074053.1 DUF4190 domain-containing protein [Streptococcus pyogenes]KLV29017.1 hypothetical protein ABW04_26575 [Priestia megaterium]MCU7713149.1 DUF4190 domain-containing protein [Priestia megaterium]MCW1049109.1 DUF4190 domain-containing protein [Priestia sp. JV24]
MTQNNSKSLISIIFGVLSMIVPYIGLIFGIVGIVFCTKSIREVKKTREQGKSIAVTGGILSTVGLCIQASVLFLALLGYTAVFY